MIYYAKDNILISTDMYLDNSQFKEITKDEYEQRIQMAIDNKEEGIPFENIVPGNCEMWE